jgi:hypothetical protein
MKDRSPFPTVFWVANLVEVLERTKKFLLQFKTAF